MQGKPTAKLIISEIVAVGVNFVPLALWFFEDYSADTIIILYVADMLATVILSVLCVLLLAPKEERLTDANRTIKRRPLVKDFLLIMLTGTFFICIFIGAFLISPAGGGGARVDLDDLLFGLKVIAAFQLFEFAANLYLLRPLSLKTSETFLAGNLGSLILLILSLIAGAFVGTFFGFSLFLPFVVVKTLIDILAPINFFTGKVNQPRAAVSRNKISGK